MTGIIQESDNYIILISKIATLAELDGNIGKLLLPELSLKMTMSKISEIEMLAQ